ncbi:MAG: hypothetical protein ACOX61_04050 [Brooklawnia sp.]|jgi:hypothetical protein
MEQVIAAIDAIWKVLAVGVLLGAGLPALFSLGVRWRAHGHRIAAWGAFIVVASAVLVGIGGIVAHGLGIDFIF